MQDVRIIYRFICNVQGAADAAGKSGAWFFFSSNQRFMVKIASDRERALLLKILPCEPPATSYEGVFQSQSESTGFLNSQ